MVDVKYLGATGENLLIIYCAALRLVDVTTPCSKFVGSPVQTAQKMVLISQLAYFIIECK